MSRITRKPKPGALRHKDKHWAQMETLRNPDRMGFKVDWAFDFIGVHKTSFITEKPYSLSAPLCLVDEKLGTRPPWESQAQFATKKEAIAKAKEIAIIHGIYVVDCH